MTSVTIILFEKLFLRTSPSSLRTTDVSPRSSPLRDVSRGGSFSRNVPQRRSARRNVCRSQAIHTPLNSLCKRPENINLSEDHLNRTVTFVRPKRFAVLFFPSIFLLRKLTNDQNMSEHFNFHDNAIT